MTRCTLTALALLAAASLCPAQPDVTPGLWTGTWKNITFGSTGPVTARVATYDGNIRLQINADGNVFGQPNPDPFILRGALVTSGNTDFTLTDDPTMGDMTVSVTQAGAITVTGDNVPAVFVNAFSATGTITATSIHLDGDINVITSQTVTTEIDLTFAEPICRADCDQSDSLDLFDLLCFLNTFDAQHVDGDCDCDADYTLFDVLCFLNLMNEGCN